MRRLLVLVAVLVMIVPGVALAQTPTADEDEGAQTFILNRAGIERESTAFINFEVAGFQIDGPSLLQFVVSAFDDEDTAKKALSVLHDEYLDETISRLPDDVRATANGAEASAPNVGDEQFATIMTIVNDPWTISYGVVYVRIGRFIVGAGAAGIMGNMIEETTPYLELMIDRVDSVDSSTDEGVAEALPELADMPAGFIISSED